MYPTPFFGKILSPMRKAVIFFIGIITIIFLLYKTIFTPHLISTANRLVNLIVTQESTEDCTCWSTVRIMEFHQAELPLNFNAMALKIEVMKAILWDIWLTTSHSNESFESSLNNILSPNYTNWINSIKQPSNLSQNLTKTQQFHYHNLTEHYRYLLSIIYDIANEKVNPSEFKELSIEQIEQLAVITTHLNTELLKEAKKSAIKNHHPEIFVIDIKNAYQKLIENLNLKKVQINEKAPSIVYKQRLKQLTKKMIKNKIKSLKKYNQSIWKNEISLNHQAKLLSKIFEFNISEEELKQLIQVIKKNSMYLFYQIESQRIDNIEKLETNNLIMNKKDYGNVIVTFQDEFHRIQQEWPFNLKKNGDIEFKYYLYEFEKDFDLSQKTSVFFKDNIRGYKLDSIRDTIIHWTIINSIQENHRIGILDPFALELLSERLSEYIGILLKITESRSKSVRNEFKDFEKIKFFQMNNIKELWTQKNNIPSKNYFEKVTTIDTTIKQQELTMGYFSGISTVDIDNNDTIDILLPEKDYISIYLNDGKGNLEKTIVDFDSFFPLEGIHAIDFNQDYKLDLVVIGLKNITFLKQTSHLKFEKTQTFNMSAPFTMCTNDIDNDGDIDVYVTQIYESEFPSLGGRNGHKNQLFLNENSTMTPISIPAIESKGMSLACSIIDINNDDKKDIIIINDFGRDELFMQSNQLQFIDKAKEYEFDDAGSGMNLSIIDFNQDNYWDIYITMVDMFNKQLSFQLPVSSSEIDRSERILKTSTYLIGNQLYIGNEDHFIKKTHEIFEPGLKGWGWGTSFFDYDNDQFDDIYITNGRLVLNDPKKQERNILMINKNNLFFYSNSTSEESKPMNSRGVSAVDLNNNGRMDLVVRNPKNAIIFQNIDKNTNNWIKIKLIGKQNNTFAIGSEITIKTNNKTQKKIILAETGYRTQEPYIKHFGIGKEKIKEISITWPDKKTTIIKKPKAMNKLLTIKYPN